jgi:CheY-like chemotaxis protein
MAALLVLHVDDDPDIREVVAGSLGLDPDLVTRSCASGVDALAVVAEWPPDIILMDVMMPLMDGPTTLAHLRRDERTAGIPVVFMTARAQSREIDAFLALGAAGVIRKPFDPRTLAASLRPYLRPADHWLDSIRKIFLLRLRDDAVMLESLGAALATAPPTEMAEILAGMKEIAHGLAGAGGIFGFPDISSAAAAIEEAIIAKSDGAGATAAIASALRCLLACVDRTPQPREEQARARLRA